MGYYLQNIILSKKLWLEIKLTDKYEYLLHKIELLELLVKGCRVHPAYRAIRPATGNCLPCVDMWKARQELNDLANIETECCDDACCESSGCC